MQSIERVAAAGADTQPGQVEQNLEKIATWTAEAANQGAQLVLFPELSLSGFIPNHPRHEHQTWLRDALAFARRSAMTLTAPALDALRQIADRHRILICTGMLEDAGNLLYNTQVLVGPSGLIAVWRKMHVPMFEMPFYNGGPAVRVVETSLGRLGANICFDVLLPESTRLLAVDNVEIVLMPFAADPPPGTAEAWRDWAAPAIRARAQENGVFAIASNYVGHVECAGVTQDFPGGGLIVSPRGEVIAQSSAKTGECGLLVADLHAEQLEQARGEAEYLYRFRRPELYGPLTQHPAP